jgi:hypothetical protein
LHDEKNAVAHGTTDSSKHRGISFMSSMHKETTAAKL